MKAEFIKLGDMPKYFYESLRAEFTPYTVGLCRIRDNETSTFTPLGSGVLVRKNGRTGVLTAYHCLHECSPEVNVGIGGADDLILVLRSGRTVQIKSSELYEHKLAVPISAEFGPDLSFVEIAPGDGLGYVSAIASIWNLDCDYAKIVKDFNQIGMGTASIGYPELYCKTAIKGKSILRICHHMTFHNSIGPSDIVEKNGWDYINTKCVYESTNNLPLSFEGLSGGPIWAFEVRKNDKDGTLTIGKSALVGITFFQTAVDTDSRYLRGQFIRSIYDLAWKSFS